MFVERHEVSITVDASGNGTGYTPVVAGFVRAIRYVPDGTSPYATGVDVTVTGDVSGIAVTTITNAGTSAIDVFPRAATAGITNSAALYAAAGTAVNDLIPIANEKVKIALAQGGNTTTGKFHVYIG
jgi:hypothetical protein